MEFKLAGAGDFSRHGSSPLNIERPSVSEKKSHMRIRPIVFILFSVCFQIAFITTVWGQSNIEKCRAQLSPLEKIKNTVIEYGGMWTLFERSKNLRPMSSKAVQLDSKVQQLVWLLDYLCATLDGVPLNDLATYVTQSLKEKSKIQFKKELIVLGKSEDEIDIWFVFSDISLNNEHRKLKGDILHISIQKALPLLHKYQALAEGVEQSPEKLHLEKVDGLYREIEQLESSDSYLARALLETSQVPHWDIDESTGGS